MAQPDLEKLREAIKKGRSVETTIRNYRKDGSLFWNRLRISPINNEAGSVTHFLGVQYDVTGLHEAKQALTDERSFNSAVLNTTEAMVVLDEQGQPVFVNKAFERTMGFTFDEISDATFWNRFVPTAGKTGRSLPQRS